MNDSKGKEQKFDLIHLDIGGCIRVCVMRFIRCVSNIKIKFKAFPRGLNRPV